VLDFVDANGATGGVSPVLKTRYLHGPAVDQILAQEELDGSGNSADVLWMLTDHLGSVRDIVNQAGEAVSHVTYDAFGNIVGGTGVLLTRYLYTGRELDTLTGLQYNRNRWYDPALGRWISEDPIGFWGGDYNLGRYVENGPPNGIDATGRLWSEVWAGIQGTGQGALNIVNGVQDLLIGAANIPALGVNSIAWLEEQAGILDPQDALRVPYIPSPDWSRGMLTEEAGTGWADTHNWSKFVGGTAVTCGVGGWTRASMLARGFNAGNFVGKQAIVSSHLPAGKYAALVIDGKVYVARMHIVAWELAGKRGVETFYGFAEIDAFGKVVSLFK